MVQVKLIKPDTIEIEMAREVTADDFRDTRTEIEKIFAERGKMKFIFDIRNVSHFTLGAVYQDILTDLKNFKNIGTTAVVCNTKLFQTLVEFFDKFYPEKIEHFEDLSTAKSWIATQ